LLVVTKLSTGRDIITSQQSKSAHENRYFRQFCLNQNRKEKDKQHQFKHPAHRTADVWLYFSKIKSTMYRLYNLHLLRVEQKDLPTVRNNLDEALQMQLNAQLVQTSSCPGKKKQSATKSEPHILLY
jgi:hypothetical protein